jgi:peptidoglycan/LPS O-acetylase OafA/YrhL
MVVMGGVVAAGFALPLQGDDLPALARNTVVRAIFLAAAAVAVTGLMRARNPRRKLAWGGTLLVLLATDVWTHGPNPSPTVKRACMRRERVAGA